MDKNNSADVPVRRIGNSESRFIQKNECSIENFKRYFKQNFKRNRCSKAAALILLLLAVGVCIGISAKASGPGYEYIEQTENRRVIELTEQMAQMYPICPELLQAMIFYESSNQPGARNGSCIGYMQVNPRWHRERMDRLGVSDLYDGYSNILTGTDYLMELIKEYGDVATALMVYHGERNAERSASEGVISDYAGRILNLSSKLERLHGK